MKMCILCFVYNTGELSSDQISSKSPFNYMNLFESSSALPEPSMNLLQELIVKPISVLIRRMSVNAEKYLSISQIQSKYRASSKIHITRSANRAFKVNQMKVNKKRRDHLEIRTKVKATIKSANSVWNALNRDDSLSYTVFDEEPGSNIIEEDAANNP